LNPGRHSGKLVTAWAMVRPLIDILMFIHFHLFIIAHYIFQPKWPSSGIQAFWLKEPDALLLCRSAFHFCKYFRILQMTTMAGHQ
jgi:hypothetical protein